MRYVRPDDIEWAIDVAAKSGKVHRGLIMTTNRQAPLPEVRRGMAWFLRHQLAWSFPRIARAMHRDHSTIIHTMQKGEPVLGEVSYTVWKDIRKAHARKTDQDRMQLVKAASKIAHIGSLLRVMPPDKAGVVGIEMWHNGRMLPTRREWAADVRGLTDDSEARYYRVTEAPAWMGTVVLVPISEADWDEATQRRLVA